MKYTIPLVLALAMTGCISLAPIGTESTELFLGANTIYVKPQGENATPSEALEYAALMLTEQGWYISTVGATILTTEWRDVGSIFPVMNMRITVAASQQQDEVVLIIRGEAGSSHAAPYPITHRGESGGGHRRAWDAMERGAISVGSVTLYARRQH